MSGHWPGDEKNGGQVLVSWAEVGRGREERHAPAVAADRRIGGGAVRLRAVARHADPRRRRRTKIVYEDVGALTRIVERRPSCVRARVRVVLDEVRRDRVERAGCTTAPAGENGWTPAIPDHWDGCRWRSHG